MCNTNTKLYNKNIKLKQNHKIRNTNTELYNTSTNLKQNHKSRKFVFVLWSFVLVLRILWFCFEFVFVL